MTAPSCSPPPPPRDGVPLPKLSDEAAVEISLFIEHLFLLFEARYGDQIRRHCDELSRHNLIEPDFDSPLDDPPF
jgi:hypothetical protein